MMPTFSNWERADACPGSVALPRADSQGDDANDGNAVHDFLEVVAENPVGRWEALSAVSIELKARCAAIDLPSLLDELETCRTEVAIALNIETGFARVIGAHLKRRYPALEPGEICGTLDLLATKRGIPYIRDWKTGRDCTPARDNWQLRLQALAIAQLTGADKVDAGIVYIHDDGSTWTDRHVFDMFELDALLPLVRQTRDRVLEALALVEAGRIPDVAEGSHCRYCPAFVYCPAKNALARSMTSEFTVLAPQIAAMSAEQAGNAWAKAKQVEKILESVLGALKERAKRELIPLASGKMVAPVESMRTSVDAQALAGLAKSLGATEEQIAACSRRSPVVSIREIKRKNEEAA